MSEIVEKMLLISFGVVFLIILMPLFGSLISLNQNEYLTNQEQVNMELNRIKSNIEEFENNNVYENTTYSFSFMGNISILLNSNQNDSNHLIFRFKNRSSIQYGNLIVSLEYKIEITENFVHAYTIGYSNFSKFIMFF